MDLSKDNLNTAPSPEEVVADLTKDLEEGLKTDLSNCKSNESETGNKVCSGDSELDAENGHISDSEDEKPVIEDDFVDEEALKDLELTLDESEKEARHKTSLEFKEEGNEKFKSGEYLESIKKYTDALRLCPLSFQSDRSVLYANRAASKTKLERNASAIDDCSKAIELNESYLKAYLRRAKLYEQTDKLDESLQDFKKILELDPDNKDALSAVHRLPPLINEKNEKLKTEMLGKLKDLGNMFLRPFGLSTENFELQQNQESGGYSINFKQNPRS